MLTLHLASLFGVGAVILAADRNVFAWIRGKKIVLRESRLRLLHALTWLCLVSLIATGTIMAYPMRSYLLSDPAFIEKMLFVAILAVNALLIGRLMGLATKRSYASLSRHEKAPLFMSGAVSLFSWLAATYLGYHLFP